MSTEANLLSKVMAAQQSLQNLIDHRTLMCEISDFLYDLLGQIEQEEIGPARADIRQCMDDLADYANPDVSALYWFDDGLLDAVMKRLRVIIEKRISENA